VFRSEREFLEKFKGLMEMSKNYREFRVQRKSCKVKEGEDFNHRNTLKYFED